MLHAQDSRLWLFHKVGPTVHSWTTRVATSADGGATWSAPRPLVSGGTSPRGPVKNKLIVLANGDWLAGGSVEDDRNWDAFTDRSADQGLTWERSAVPLEHRASSPASGAPVWRGLAEAALWETDPARTFAWDGVIQPTLWESAPGRVHMLLRSTRGSIHRSDSQDGGRVWCAAYATPLANNNSGLDLVRVPDGMLVLACNPVAGNWASRSPLVLLVSTDNGARWQERAVLESGAGEFSYPAIIAAGGGLHVLYTWNRTSIVHREIAVG